MVSAWASENQLVLGQLKVDEKSNEITAIPLLLDLLDIEGSIITIDAIGTQTKIAEKIIENKADYILSVKGNQKELLAQVEESFNRHKPDSVDQVTEKGHGRIETRTCEIISNLGFIDNREHWKGLKTIVRITALRDTVKNRRPKPVSTLAVSLTKQQTSTLLYVSTGALKTNSTGHWIWFLTKTGKGKGRRTPPKTFPSSEK